MPSKADIGPKIGIEGEREFKKSIKEINANFKELVSETNAVMSAFIGNEKSTEALTAANVQLGKEADILDSKIAELENQLQKYAEANASGSDAAQKLRIQLNNTTAEFNKHQAQIQQNEEEIKKLTEDEGENEDQTDKLTMAQSELMKGAGGVDGILKALGINVQGLTNKLGLSKEQTGMLSEAMNGGGMSLAVAGTAAAASVALVAKAIKEFTEFMVESVSVATDYADNINTMATNFHISAEKLQEYQYMAELTDTSLDTITGSISKLTRTMDKTRDGNAEAAEAFAKLNIRVTDANGELRDSSEVFEQAVGALNMIHNETERDAIAMTLFGRSAMDLNSLIASMADGSFQQFQEEARKMGYVLSDEEITALRQLDDEFVRFDNQMTAVKNQIAAEMAPALIELAQQLLEVAQTVDWREFGQAAADIIKDLTPMIVDLAEAIAAVANAIISVREALGNSKALTQYWSDVKTVTGTMARHIPGIGTAIQAYDTASSLYNAFNPINVTLELDKQTLAQVMVDPLQDEQNRRGPRATY